jgi:hypothetical protein
MPINHFSSFSWRHGGYRNGPKPPPTKLRTLREQLTWSRGVLRPLRNWERKYGVDQPLYARAVTCKRCHTTQATFYHVQGDYFCQGCMTTLIRRSLARRKPSPPKTTEEV